MTDLIPYIIAAIFFSLWMAKRARFRELGRRFANLKQRNAELVVEVAWRDEKIEILERKQEWPSFVE